MRGQPFESTRSFLAFGFLSSCLLFGLLAGAAPAEARTVTIRAVFRSLAPDGTDKPIRYAYVELLDQDPVSNDVLGRSSTELDGTVSFQYDSEQGDGWMGGRVDPFLRCYCRLMVPSGDVAVHKASVVWSDATLQCEYFLDSTVWSGNTEDRSVQVRIAEGNAQYALFQLDCLAEANLRPQIPFTDRLDQAPAAIGGDICGGKTDVDYPVATKTGFQGHLGEIWLTHEYEADFDTILHEYGHHQMWDAYGSLVFGDYSKIQGDHNFNSECEDAWSAFAEGWADFTPVITKGYPEYRLIDIENERPGYTRSDLCEATICRILWDLWDNHDSKVFEAVLDQKHVLDRPLTAGVRLDDDPVGFTDFPPFGAWRGRAVLKSIIAHDHPKSIWDFKSGWDKHFARDGLARRALEAIFWQHGVRAGINDSAPACTLRIEGTRNGDICTGPLILRAEVTDADITAAAPYDGQLMHVAFYYAHYLEATSEISGARPSDWYPIGIDIKGSDGFGVEWPETARRPPENQKVVLIAVASDFFDSSTYGYKPEKFTAAQIGPILIKKGSAGTDGGGGELKPAGPLTEVGYYSIGPSAYGIRVHGDKLYIAAWGQGLLIVDISKPESPRLISKFRPSDITRTDYCRDVDTYSPEETSGRGRLYAVLAYSSAGMRIVDVTNPAKPFQVGGLGGSDVYANRVRVAGRHAVFWDTGQTVVDLSTPANPGPVIPWLKTSLRVNRHEVNDVAVCGDAVYLACGKRGLVMLSLSDILAMPRTEPREERDEDWLKLIRGRYDDGHDLRALDIVETGGGRRLAMGLYLLGPVPGEKSPEPGKYRLSALDVTEPKNIKEIQSFDLEHFPNDVAVDGSRVFVGHSRGVSMFDFSDPSAPKKICDFKGNFTYAGGEMAFYKDYVIVLVANDHIGVLKLNY